MKIAKKLEIPDIFLKELNRIKSLYKRHKEEYHLQLNNETYNLCIAILEKTK